MQQRVVKFKRGRYGKWVRRQISPGSFSQAGIFSNENVNKYIDGWVYVCLCT